MGESAQIQEQVLHFSNKTDEPIVIVGAACRFAGEATSLRGLYEMMRDSRTGHGQVPKERWDAEAWYHPDPDRKGAVATKAGFFLAQDVAHFDAPFFSVPPKEAAGMDPQKRLLLEVAYETFENVNIDFDDRANGYGRGEGVGALLVKRLSDAIRDGDVIRAVIRGSAINVDGKTPSVTMPSGEAQAELIRTAYKQAGLPLNDTRYVEMHGTGTPVGDPIELSAIASTFGKDPGEMPVYVGSIKPSVGHTEGCAGLAGVFRAILSLEQGCIFPTFGVERVNPKLRFDDRSLALPQKVIPWPTSGLRRVSINSFGFGGANAHVILDDAYHYLQQHGIQGAAHSTVVSDGTGPNEEPQKKKLFVFSARDQKALEQVAKSHQQHCSSSSANQHAASLAYTLSTRRTQFDHRSFAVADSLSDLSNELQIASPKPVRSAEKLNGLVFIFTGQGAQWSGMGKELLGFPAFRDSMARSANFLQKLGCAFDLLAELEACSEIDSPQYSQPICTAVQVGLVDLLQDWAVRPRAVVGHSSGEIPAAYAAGLITHQDAVTVAYFRGIYSLKVTKNPARRGGMLAAGISQAEAQEVLSSESLQDLGQAVAACINSPKSVTISGDSTLIDYLEKKISDEGNFARKLRVSTAYHSPHMRDVADECLAAMKGAGVSNISTNPGETSGVMMFSSVTGQLLQPSEVNAEYWIRNMCQPVLFSQAVTELLKYSSRKGRKSVPLRWNAIVEVGPHSALKAPLTQIMEAVNPKLPIEQPYTSVLVRKQDAIVTSLKAAGMLWALGNPISFSKVNREDEEDAGVHTVADLPAYPWTHDRRHWYEPRCMASERRRPKPRTDLLGFPVDNAKNTFEPQWKNYLSVRENPWIEDHAITGTTLYPGAGMLIMVVEAAQQLAESHPEQTMRGIEFHDVHFERGLVIPADSTVETQLSIKGPQGQSRAQDSYGFSVFSSQGGADVTWTRHCFGSFSIVYEEKQEQNNDFQDPAAFDWTRRVECFYEMKKGPARPVDVERLYQELHKVGMEYGETFQNLTSLHAAEDGSRCYGTIKIPDTASVMPFNFEYPHIIHPATLDAIFHLMVYTVADSSGALKEAAVPYHLKRLYLATKGLPRSAGSLFHGYATSNKTKSKGQLSANLVVSDDTWKDPMVIVDGLVMRQVTAGTSSNEISDGISAGQKIEPRCTLLQWKLDPEAFMAASSSAVATVRGVTRLQHWLEIENHKSADLRLLVVGSTLSASAEVVLDELHEHVASNSLYRGISHLIVTDANEERLGQWQSAIAAMLDVAEVTQQPTNVRYHVWDPDQDSQATSESITSLVSGGEKYSLVLTGESCDPERMAATLEPHLHKGGRILYLQPTIEGAAFHTGQIDGSNTIFNDQSRSAFVERHVALDNGTLKITARKPQGLQMNNSPASVATLLLPPMDRLNSENATALKILANEVGRILQDQLGIAVQQASLAGYASAMTSDNSQRSTSSGTPIIALLDLCEGGFVAHWTADDFGHFKVVMNSTRQLLWVTHGAQMVNLEATSQALEGLNSAPVTGLLRVLRNEMPHIALTHLDLALGYNHHLFNETSGPHSTASTIVQAWLLSGQDDSQDHGAKEREYAQVNGELYVPRSVPQPTMDFEIAVSTGKAPSVLKSIHQSESCLILDTSEGSLNGVWQPAVLSPDDMDPDEIEIRVTSTSTCINNSGSVSQVVSDLGTQTMGLITRCGANVSPAAFAPGDAVAVLGKMTDGLRTHIRQLSSLVYRIQPGSSSAELDPSTATFLWIKLLACYILDDMAQLRESDVEPQNVLIHNGSNALSQMVISLARRLGARVFSTVSTDAERDLLVKLHGLEHDDVIKHLPGRHGGDLAAYLLQKTGDVGIDVLVASDAGFVRGVGSWMADFGRIVVVSGGDIDGDQYLPWTAFKSVQEKSLSVSTLRPDRIIQEKPQLLKKLLKRAKVSGTLLSQTATKSRMTSTTTKLFSVDQLHEVSSFLDELKARDGNGISFSVLGIEFSKDALVPVPPPKPSQVQLDSNGTYILAGGLGSLGLRIARLMAQHGAKYLVLLSRSGLKPDSKYSDDIASLVAQYGCTIDVGRCDVTKRDEVKASIQDLLATGRPIRGLVQCAMVLADSIFENMSHAQWTTAYAPKVAGTWYLHELIPEEPLDFFIMLSSIVSIMGNVSQANYAAGNAWMDALAHYRRRHLHLPATSLNVGLVLDSDHTIDGASLLDGGYLERFDHMASVSTTLDELDIGLLACMREGRSEMFPPQFVFGMVNALPTKYQWTADAKFVHRLENSNDAGGVREGDSDGESKTNIADELAAVGSLYDATLVVFEYLTKIDSFKAVEIRNYVFRQLKSDLSVFEILSPSPLAQVAEWVAERSPLVPAKVLTATVP
ncbi:Type I Iterative PKS [Gnomoniopsis sp. IMI 355080]|nr:Type I Iterative PKS [Gnomoniopsis sp. IMI 355080]